MIEQILLALLLTSITVAVHIAGALRVVLPLSSHRRKPADYDVPRDAVMFLVRLVSGLLILHLAEMAIWAAAFTLAGVFGDFETAMYYSLKSYTTVGYGDVLPSPSWRLLGPIEAAVGVLMLGISTSIIFAVVQRIHFSGLVGAVDTSAAGKRVADRLDSDS